MKDRVGVYIKKIESSLLSLLATVLRQTRRSILYTKYSGNTRGNSLKTYPSRHGAKQHKADK